MISERYVKKFCCEDISLIENYAEAISDKENIWHCHHRDEIRELPSGMVVLRSMQELIENGRYFNCPANELIFMKNEDHKALHARHQKCSAETRAKLSKIHTGMKGTRNGVKLSDETKAKLRAANLGKKHTEEERKKISEANKLRWAKYRASKEV